jgi:hypothetical protein
MPADVRFLASPGASSARNSHLRPKDRPAVPPFNTDMPTFLMSYT